MTSRAERSLTLRPPAGESFARPAARVRYRPAQRGGGGGGGLRGRSGPARALRTAARRAADSPGQEVASMPPRFRHAAEYLENAARKWPRKPAFMAEGRAWSYAELLEESGRLAAWLQAHAGLGPGQRLGLATRNRPELVIAYWAAIRLGATVLPINYRLGQPALAHLLAEGELSCLVADEAGWRGVAAALPAVSCQPVLVSIEGGPAQAHPWGEAWASPTTLREPELDPTAPAIILYTSGTTGLPKGAVMTHEALRVNLAMAIIAHSLRHEDIHLLALPFFVPTACYTLINVAAYLGSTLALAADAEMSTVLPLLASARCTTFFGVPTMFFFLTVHPRLGAYDLSSLRLVAYSGSPMPVRTIRRLRELLPGVWLHNFFGLTETIAMTHVLPNADADTRPESIGKLLPEIDAQVVGPAGQPLAPGEIGELVIGREAVIPYYWRRPGLLEQSLRDGWFHTGDLASVDQEGYFYMHGRSKDMVIVAGQNVYCLEVEQVIMRLEQVREVAVVGVPATGVRAPLGELLKAVVVPHPGEVLTAREVKRHCAQHLPSYKVPHIVEFRDALPRNPAGKVLKEVLRQEQAESAPSSPAPAQD
jgi:acyl-CoA synthetase (AMP-forming)/AMP-acid ligase II